MTTGSEAVNRVVLSGRTRAQSDRMSFIGFLENTWEFNIGVLQFQAKLKIGMAKLQLGSKLGLTNSVEANGL